jgi:hypothetical protein
MNSLILLFLSCYVLMELLQAWSTYEAKHFLRTTTSIGGAAELDRFKVLARRDMRLALLLIPIWLVALIAGFVIINRYGALGLAAVLAANTISIVSSRAQKRYVVRARGIEAVSTDLQREKERVIHTWLKRPFPDF